MNNFNVARLKASSLFLVVLATAIFALYIQEISQLIWQQKKIINLEKKQLEVNKHEQTILRNVITTLSQYKYIDDIPDVNLFNTNHGQVKASVAFYNKNLALLLCDAYKIYKIEMLNLFDLDIQQTYHSKLHTFVAVCEYGKSLKDGEAKKSVSFSTKVFTVSNFVN